MKDLKSLTKKERVDVLIQCCSGFLSYNNTKAVQSVYNKIKDDFALPKCSKEIKVLITVAGRAIKIGCGGSQLPMGTRKYTVANRVSKQSINKERMQLVVEKADELGYIDFYTGYKDVMNDCSVMSCFIIKDTFLSLFTDSVLKSFKSGISKDEVVEVKDENGDLINKLTRFAGVGDYKNLMLDYNSVLNTNDIRVGIRKAFVAYKQVFSIDLEGAGRYYTLGGFQTIKSITRKNITINGSSTIEIDIVSNHLSIMYTLEAIKLDSNFDCYHVDIGDYDYEDIRLLCKYAIMCMINCKTKSGSYGALHNILEKDFKSDRKLAVFNCNKDLCKTTIDKLLEKHNKLTFFEKGLSLWRKLQRLDSKVCEGIIRHFTYRKEKAVVLCYHDSWRVESRYKEELYQCIRDSWFKVFGTYDNCYLKVE